MNELFGAFLTFDPDLPRPIRITVYYLRISIIMAITALFTQVSNIYTLIFNFNYIM
jgi:hypothetical protein